MTGPTWNEHSDVLLRKKGEKKKKEKEKKKNPKHIIAQEITVRRVGGFTTLNEHDINLQKDFSGSQRVIFLHSNPLKKHMETTRSKVNCR